MCRFLIFCQTAGVRLFKNVFFLAASLLSVFTLAVSIVGGAATISASGSASAAEADYIL